MSLGWSGNLRAVAISAAIAVGASLGLLAPAAMAAPVNDNFANRTQLGDELPVHVTESNVDATREAGEEIGVFAKGRSIWWEWEAPITGWITVSTCESGFLTVVNAFEGTDVAHLISMTDQRSNANQGPQCWATGTAYTFHATQGHDYAIGADGNGFYVPPPPPEEAHLPSGEGEIKLSIEATPPPPNDAFATPIRLGEHLLEMNQSPFEEPNEDEYFWEQTPGYNFGATKEAGEPDHAGDPGGASVWYSWTPTRSGEVSISLQGAGGPKLLALYKSSTLAELVPLASSSSPIEPVNSPVIAGEEYRIAVDGSQVEHPLETWRGSFMGSFNLSIRLVAPPLACACVGDPPPPVRMEYPPFHRIESSLYPPITLLGHRFDTRAHSATFRFSSPTAGATFVCKVDAKPYSSCSSPFKVKGLKPGKHVFRVLATVNGMTSTSPGVVHFSVPARHPRHHRGA
ncbi:MAG TPA: hypothetical protein VJL81_15920 [Solirubrobacterales bacterium]|nr:hypothetical protein [Solirubrobacterales bacterium]